MHKREVPIAAYVVGTMLLLSLAGTTMCTGEPDSATIRAAADGGPASVRGGQGWYVGGGKFPDDLCMPPGCLEPEEVIWLVPYVVNTYCHQPGPAEFCDEDEYVYCGTASYFSEAECEGLLLESGPYGSYFVATVHD